MAECAGERAEAVQTGFLGMLREPRLGRGKVPNRTSQDASARDGSHWMKGFFRPAWRIGRLSFTETRCDFEVR